MLSRKKREIRITGNLLLTLILLEASITIVNGKGWAQEKIKQNICAVTNVAVVDVEKRALFPNRTVIISGDRI